ncbi:hypothetical protein EDD22DRAFT_214704 [Suillus occidentalis]|nr:hypothetical protein EDD22DRAFT_214704 [Suillus occidentalis]
MSEDTEDVKPKLSLVINYEGTRQSSLHAIPARGRCLRPVARNHCEGETHHAIQEDIRCSRGEIHDRCIKYCIFIKLHDVHQKRFGKEPGTFKFTYDGKRLRAENTPMDMEMEDGDIIDAHLEQLGGGPIIC